MMVRLNEFMACIQQIAESPAIVNVLKRETSGESTLLNSYQITPGSDIIEETEYGQATILTIDVIDPKEIKVVIDIDN